MVWVVGNNIGNARKVALVAGGAGFIGSHLCERLIAMERDVICVDNLLTGDLANLEQLPASRLTFQHHDIIEPIEAGGRVDEIFNLACAASPPHYQADPLHTTMTNVVGSLNLLGVARQTGARIFQASTSEVYGDPDIHPQPETYRGNVNPFGPRACYDEGKRCAESIFFDHKRKYGTSIRIARIFNTYGPRMSTSDGRVVSNFIVQALQNQNLTVYGDGSQTRSLCYVDDLVDGIIAMMGLPESPATPINLGSCHELTVLEIAQLVIELTRSRSRIIRLALPEDDPRRRQPDISLAERTLGWTPKVSVRDGLGRTIAYFDAALMRSSHAQKLVS